MSGADVLNQGVKINKQLYCATCEPDADRDDQVPCPITIVEQECGWDYPGNQAHAGGKQRYFFRRTYTTAIGLEIRRPLPKCIDEEFVKQGLGASQTGYKRA
jgi:hypothetical protein